jgi:hypothetical protein
MIAPENNGGKVDRKSLCKDGETRRDVGMALAAARRPDRVTLGRVRLLQALLASPAGTATIDDASTADELSSGFADGGRWRGTVTRSLVADGFAVIVHTTRSVRPSRHRGYVSVLKLVDRVAAENYVQTMIAAFAAFNEATSPAGTDEVAKPDTAPNTTNEGVSNHEVE